MHGPVRNHEQGNGVPFMDGSVDDPTAAGGTTNLIFHPGPGRWGGELPQPRRHDPQLRRGNDAVGLVAHLRGGPSAAPAARRSATGWVFEVPAARRGLAGRCRHLGRFNHEAAAVDPRTGVVYLTEDRQDGFYRFVPDTPGDLSSGTLQMLAIADVPITYTADTGSFWGVTDWVTIDNPDRGPGGDVYRPAGPSQGWHRDHPR